MQIFLTGALGYIGGSVAARLKADGHEIIGLVRSDAKADQARAQGLTPVIGGLDDSAVLADTAGRADAVINCASADHLGAIDTLLDTLAGTDKPFIHTSGSSIVGTQAGGEVTDAIYAEDTPLVPSPGRAARVALNEHVLAGAARGVRTIIVAPSLIYGLGHGATAHSMQIPWLIDVAKKFGVAKHIGSGGNIWSNVHIDDVVTLFALALEKAPAGGFYYGENGENSMQELCAAISRMLGFGGATQSMTVDEAALEWGEGPAKNTMGSNSRVRGVRARAALGWSPSGRSAIEEIEQGCYVRY